MCGGGSREGAGRGGVQLALWKAAVGKKLRKGPNVPWDCALHAEEKTRDRGVWACVCGVFSPELKLCRISELKYWARAEAWLNMLHVSISSRKALLGYWHEEFFLHRGRYKTP